MSDEKNPTDPTGKAAEAAEQNAPLPDWAPPQDTKEKPDADKS